MLVVQFQIEFRVLAFVVNLVPVGTDSFQISIALLPEGSSTALSGQFAPVLHALAFYLLVAAPQGA